VVERWHQLFGGTILSERYLRKDKLLEVEETQLEGLVEIWRERLTSVSWLLTNRAASPGTGTGVEVLGQLQPDRLGNADELQDRRQILGQIAASDLLRHFPDIKKWIAIFSVLSMKARIVGHDRSAHALDVSPETR